MKGHKVEQLQKFWDEKGTLRGKIEVLVKFKVKADILAKNKLQNLQNATIKPSKRLKDL